MNHVPKHPEDHKDIIGQVMHRWKHKDPSPLHSGVGEGGKEGKIVKTRDQAIAIALSLSGKSRDHTERLSSLGFSQDSIAKANKLLKSSEDAAFITGVRKNLFPRENKTTEAKGLSTQDIDSRPGVQGGGQGKSDEDVSETFSPSATGLSNPQTTPPSLSNRKGYSMFEEAKCPPKRTPAQKNVTQQAAQASQQQGQSFDQRPTQDVKKLGQQGGQAQRKTKKQNCP